MEKWVLILIIIVISASLMAQEKSKRLDRFTYPQEIFTKNQMAIKATSFENSEEGNTKISIWTELGYILAMETTFLGMSYLASRKNRFGSTLTGGFDVFMGTAGLLNMSEKTDPIQLIGYALLSAGFFAKAFYNFRLGKHHYNSTRFWTNFIGFNVLVFSGYYLDSL